MKKKLEEITSNVIKRIREFEICMPSDYIREFNTEICTEEELDILVNDKISQDLTSARKLLDNTSALIKKSINKIENVVEDIDQTEEESKLSCFVKKEMSGLLSEIKNLSKELYTDELTGAKNRRWLFKEFINDRKEFSKSGVIVFLDLNKFKDINDTFGHVTGDKILIYLVSFLNKELQKYINDFEIVRFAGDEFIIIFKENNDKKYINGILETLLSKLESQKLKPANSENKSFFQISFSFGIMNYAQNDSFSKIINKVDSDMYLMKKIRKEDR